MPRLICSYAPDIGAGIQLALTYRLAAGGWAQPHVIDAFIDSGATHSSLPLADVHAMGLGSYLAPDGTVRFANGALEPKQRLTVQVKAKLINPADKTYWGPTFDFSPSVKQRGERLLGTDDFFQLFEVSFWPDPRAASFSLVY